MVDEEIELRFTYHAPTGPEQVATYALIREEAKKYAYLITAHTPVSREQSLALTYLETCVFFTNAAIARRQE